MTFPSPLPPSKSPLETFTVHKNTNQRSQQNPPQTEDLYKFLFNIQISSSTICSSEYLLLSENKYFFLQNLAFSSHH